MTAPSPGGVQPFQIGDRVRKTKGFRFPGVIRAVFLTSADKWRVVVEAEHADFAGMLHIYDPAQLEVVP